MLDKLGVSADMARNGAEAIELIVEGREYDVVLMDMHMPVMDGCTAVGLLRESGHDIPVLATGATTEEDRIRCITAGCDDYLAKPVSAESLADAIGSAMARICPVTCSRLQLPTEKTSDPVVAG